MRSVHRRAPRPITDLRTAINAHESIKIDFSRIDALVEESSAFRERLHEYVSFNKEDIQRREEEYAKALQQAAEARLQHERETEDAHGKVSEMINTLNEEQQEQQKMQIDVAEHRERRSQARENASAIDADITEVKAAITRVQKKLVSDQRIMEEQLTKIQPELDAFESFLGCSIEGIKRDTLLFRFTRLDEASPSREFSFVLDVSNKDYRAPTSSPLLPALPGLLDQLNQNGDFQTFIKRVRMSFRDYSREERGGRG